MWVGSHRIASNRTLNPKPKKHKRQKTQDECRMPDSWLIFIHCWFFDWTASSTAFRGCLLWPITMPISNWQKKTTTTNQSKRQQIRLANSLSCYFFFEMAKISQAAASVCNFKNQQLSGTVRLPEKLLLLLGVFIKIISMKYNSLMNFLIHFNII